MVDEPHEVSGVEILRGMRRAAEPYRDVIAAKGKNVAIIRFEATQDDPLEWQQRMEASRISARQKVRSFEYLGLDVHEEVLPPGVSDAEFQALIQRYNQDQNNCGIIVQFPPPARLRQFTQEILPDRDLDALLGDRSPYRACATAEGIWHVVEPYTADDPLIAVVGSKGFVGQGVTRLLDDHGLRNIGLDKDDDLSQVADADIVISVTGVPGTLGPEHLRPHQRLVVDSGFVPQLDGSVLSDVQPAAKGIPQHITPVPGGIGPVEMSVLIDRMVRKEGDASFVAPKPTHLPYLTKAEMAGAKGIAGLLATSFPVSTSQAVAESGQVSTNQPTSNSTVAKQHDRAHDKSRDDGGLGR